MFVLLKKQQHFLGSVCVFLSETFKSCCPMQENYELFKDLIQTIGLLY